MIRNNISMNKRKVITKVSKGAEEKENICWDVERRVLEAEERVIREGQYIEHDLGSEEKVKKTK